MRIITADLPYEQWIGYRDHPLLDNHNHELATQVVVASYNQQSFKLAGSVTDAKTIIKATVIDCDDKEDFAMAMHAVKSFNTKIMSKLTRHNLH